MQRNSDIHHSVSAIMSLLDSSAESKIVILVSLLSTIIVFGIVETGVEERSEIDE